VQWTLLQKVWQEEWGCYDAYAPGGGACCGDELDEVWADVPFGNFCCFGEFHLNTTDPDDSRCACTYLGDPDLTPIIICEDHGDTYCWDYDYDSGTCCGNEEDETWEYQTDEDIDTMLPLASCVEGSWYDRTVAESLTVYDVWK